LTAAEVMTLKNKGYDPKVCINSNIELREALDLISVGHFSDGDRNLFKPLLDSLMLRDEFMVCADYSSYIECQDRVAKAYKDVQQWTKMSILNVACSGKFSSDRAILEYCKEIWHVEPVEICN
jgi:glycogen phosphorylase